jgi:hypothetical protein
MESDWEPFYSKLLNLNLTNPACWNGEAGGEFTQLETAQNDFIVAFKLKKDDHAVITIVNLTSQMRDVGLSGFSDGPYTELFSGATIGAVSEYALVMAGWDYKVFVKD